MGRDLPGRWFYRFFPCFNPRARMGRDYIGDYESDYAEVFQSTRPHGARLYLMS